MIRRPPRSTLDRSSAASDVYKRQHHPDVSKEKGAETRFKEVSEANEVLKDPEKRARYDQFGSSWKPGGAPGPGAGAPGGFAGSGGFEGCRGFGGRGGEFPAQLTGQRIGRRPRTQQPADPRGFRMGVKTDELPRVAPPPGSRPARAARDRARRNRPTGWIRFGGGTAFALACGS